MIVSPHRSIFSDAELTHARGYERTSHCHDGGVRWLQAGGWLYHRDGVGRRKGILQSLLKSRLQSPPFAARLAMRLHHWHCERDSKRAAEALAYVRR
jgi:hypothetical protein